MAKKPGPHRQAPLYCSGDSLVQKWVFVRLDEVFSYIIKFLVPANHHYDRTHLGIKVSCETVVKPIIFIAIDTLGKQIVSYKAS